MRRRSLNSVRAAQRSLGGLTALGRPQDGPGCHAWAISKVTNAISVDLEL